MRVLLTLLFLISASSVKAQHTSNHAQHVISLESKVTGNQEQPNVLSIVPWKEARDLSRIDQGIDRDINNLFQHLDAEELDRQLYFHQTFREQAQQSLASQQTHTP